MKEIEINSQAELDALPVDYNGRIFLKFGTYSEPAIIRNRTNIVLRENSSALLWGNSSAVLYGNSIAELRGNSIAELYGNSSAVLRENSIAELWENSIAVLWENSIAELWENSRAVLLENSRAVLWENSSAVLRGNSSAELWGNSQIVMETKNNDIVLHGNSRVVHWPRNIAEYADFYGIKISGDAILLYKAVRKLTIRGENQYCSDYDNSFFYRIGEIAEVSDFDERETVECGRGIHLSYLDYALRFGRGWDNLAILEIEAKTEDIIVPNFCGGKVRTKRGKVIREVPLEECGIFGQMLAKQRRKKEGNYGKTDRR